MYTLKDKVAGSLSRLFADSPSPSPPSSAPDLSQARWYSKGSKSVSSIVSDIIPSLSYGESELNDNGTSLKPVQSHPIRWKNYKLEMQHEVPNSGKEYTTTFTSEELKRLKKIWIDNDDNKQMVVKLSPHSENRDNVSERSSTDSEEFQEASGQQSPMKPTPKLSDESVFISYDLYEFLMSSLPNIVKGCEWMLLYSTLKHGISLRTLIRKSAALPGPCLLITGDKQGAVFGAMLECPLIPTPKRKYQGTNQTFVFTTKYGEPRLFRTTGVNRYYYICMNDMLALGGGGNFALSFDGDLLSGTSGPCETFGNLCLARNENFELKNVELWGFTHASRN
ncbi:hypothetical protein F3Y22_tig00000538pilonHSYRG00046 [Hibiscus syriacus]|uniref:TLDc domain-containing protein n=1 Tax=Hibiscus syriacus TaxID=106335 RepID=A0A6A3D0M7_HIBSY|nr:hypothetical protein F3Y22_tig00000538pilonHSYRG00046 [Hibiscus syriacus]